MSLSRRTVPPARPRPTIPTNARFDAPYPPISIPTNVASHGNPAAGALPDLRPVLPCLARWQGPATPGCALGTTPECPMCSSGAHEPDGGGIPQLGFAYGGYEPGDSGNPQTDPEPTAPRGVKLTRPEHRVRTRPAGNGAPGEPESAAEALAATPAPAPANEPTPAQLRIAFDHDRRPGLLRRCTGEKGQPCRPSIFVEVPSAPGLSRRVS